MWYYYVRYVNTRKQWAVYRRWRKSKTKPKPSSWERWKYRWLSHSYYGALDWAVVHNAEERRDYDTLDSRGYYDPDRGNYDDEDDYDE